jgi:hypothetical protein
MKIYIIFSARQKTQLCDGKGKKRYFAPYLSHLCVDYE